LSRGTDRQTKDGDEAFAKLVPFPSAPAADLESDDEVTELVPVDEDLDPALGGYQGGALVAGGELPDEVVLEGEVIPAGHPLPGQLPPIVAPWLRSRDEIRTRAKRKARFAAHMAAHHATHAPVYYGRLVRLAPAGAAKVAGGLWRWGTLADQAPLRDAAVAAGHAGHSAALVEFLADQRRKLWARLTTLGAGAVGAGLGAVQLAHDPHLAIAAGATGLAALGIAGRRKDRPVIDRFVPEQAGRAIDRGTVVEALTAAGIYAGTPSAKLECRVLLDPARDGDGYLVPIALPIGRKTVDDVQAARLAIAQNLGVHEDQLFVERTPGQEAGRFALWIADVDPYATTPPVSPLVTAAGVNFWEPCPFGVTGRGELVAFSMAETHGLFGAKTNMGKTFTCRIVACWAALDPDVQLWIFDGKGTADFEPFRLVAHRYVASADTESCYAVLRSLQELEAERVRRGAALKKLTGTPLAPEGKHTEKLARLRKGGMPLLFVVLDEIQEFVSDPVHGKAIAELVMKLAKLGRSVGIVLLIATQRPDKTVITPGLVAQCGIRFALKVMDQPASKLVTGVDDYAYSSHTFSEAHKGVGWLIGLGEPKRVRAHFLKTEHVRIICERARALRAKAGTLTGQAAGIEDPVSPQVLDDVLGVFQGHEDRLWTSTILARLSEAHPGRYGPTFTARELGKALRAAGVDQAATPFHGTGADGTGKTERGYQRASLMAALAAYGESPLPASDRDSYDPPSPAGEGEGSDGTGA
jgi:S-DNA-T family DNA segregation ATPase FtsK/SpoIIIE